MEDFFVNLRKYFRMGSILAIILSILITIMLYILNKASFICFDPDLCSKMNDYWFVVPKIH
jgi:hypothetical protein